MGLFDNMGAQRLIDIVMKLLALYNVDRRQGFASTPREAAEKSGKILDSLEGCLAEVERLKTEATNQRR